MKNHNLRKSHLQYLRLIATKRYISALEFRFNDEEFVKFDIRYTRSRYKSLNKILHLTRLYVLWLGSSVEGLFPTSDSLFLGPIILLMSLAILIMGTLLFTPVMIIFGLSAVFRCLTILISMLKVIKSAEDRFLIGRLRFKDEGSL